MDQLDGRLGLIYNKLIKHDLIHGDVSNESLKSFADILQMAIDTSPRENHVRDFIRHLSRRCDVLTFLRNANVPQWGLLSDGPTIERLLGITDVVHIVWDSRERTYGVYRGARPTDLSRPPKPSREKSEKYDKSRRVEKVQDERNDWNRGCQDERGRGRGERGQKSRGRGDRGRGNRNQDADPRGEQSRGRGSSIVPPMSDDQYAILLNEPSTQSSALDYLQQESRDSGWVSDNDD